SIKKNFPKFFHEASVVDRAAGAHYDWRFFNGLDIPPENHGAILHRLTRAWLRFSESAGLKTWIMHGSLLGYWWNGMNMPWDQDLDVQVTMDSLVHLARNYNQTLVIDYSLSNTELSMGLGSYLIDVGSSFIQRTKGNSRNLIDARFIDTATGLYVDITAIAKSHKGNLFIKETDEKKTKKVNELKQALDPDNELYNCRNNHFYSLDDISPLKPIYFEGVKGYIPANFKKILEREYNKSLLKYRYWGHVFRRSLRLWIPLKECSNRKNDQTCLRDSIKSEITFIQTK
ncbi:uncharacterized protein ASCRUDRAFT_22958, partial [Ascoidea rubescens DSM 1968]